MDIEPLEAFLQEEIQPVDLAELLDELVYDYIDKLVRLQLQDDKLSLRTDTPHLIHFVRRLRDVLLEC